MTIDLDHPPDEARPYVELYERTKKALDGARLRLDAYEKRVCDLLDELRGERDVRTGCALTAMTAVGRIQDMTPVIDAAVAWREQQLTTGVSDLGAVLRAGRELMDAVDEHIRKRAKAKGQQT